MWKLTVPYPVTKFLAFRGIRRFIIVLTIAVFRAMWIQPISSHPIWTFTFTVHTHLRHFVPAIWFSTEIQSVMLQRTQMLQRTVFINIRMLQRTQMLQRTVFITIRMLQRTQMLQRTVFISIRMLQRTHMLQRTVFISIRMLQRTQMLQRTVFINIMTLQRTRGEYYRPTFQARAHDV